MEWIRSLRNQWAGVAALFLVLAGGAVAAFDPVGRDGDIDACYQKKSGDLDLRKGKKCGKGEKPVSWSQVGPKGESGLPGPPGDAATKLFAFIGDNGDGATASVRYGSGVTAVSEEALPGRYIVTFDSSLANCVVQAVTGLGVPEGGPGSSLHAIPDVRVYETNANQVEIEWRNLSEDDVDTSFHIAAFC